MQSTLKPREADPHDDFAIVPDAVPAAWADKVLADITGDTASPLLDRQPPDESSAAAGTPAPTVDTTFRATDTADVEVRGGRPSTRRWAATAAWAFMLALCSGLAVAAWQHYGDAAGQMISNWTPSFAVNSSPPPQQADTPSVQASAADRTPPQAAAPQALAPAQPAESAAPAAAALAPDTAQLQAMARDVAAMSQQIEQLKASIDQLKASQQAISSDIARTSATQTSATRTPATKSSERNVRPKMPPPPPLRSAAAPSRPPMPAYPSAPAAAAPLPQAAPPAAPPPAVVSTDDEPVLRPPMPLR
ncbi:hypothetical protein KMZ29_16115 [Bradyrhizobium sediminis]|uniref:Uncharacterized protein n=1 Tax=Bradyrhizobium sediminis TaxID=2840469 RepID=A0A975RKA6_9BRAD|nr:hypothetical protein [Bradyrhizobium sediminis]QWG11277.1 hypothetical protein KMZ29_16115 [Bradyrhizobium sediminis]